jgi:hypothetical protein
LKILILFSLLGLPLFAENDFERRMLRAIYLAEGGAEAKVPFGVLSVPVDSYEEAREVALRSIRHNWRDWVYAGKPGDFVDFMARRWVPVSNDPVGNRNWRRNVKFFMKNAR